MIELACIRVSWQPGISLYFVSAFREFIECAFEI